MPTQEPFEEIQVATLAKLLDLLRLSNDHWRKEKSRWGGIKWPQSSWVFRGQGDGNWPLIPSAWRQQRSTAHESVLAQSGKVVKMLMRELRPHWIEDERFQPLAREAICEHMMVADFVRLADDLGLNVPEVTQTITDFRKLDRTPCHPVTALAPFCDPTYAHALAQHHGIATRLLDWTKNPIFACFFAAETALHLQASGKSPKTFAVYSLHTQEMGRRGGLESFFIPRSYSAFLHAQDGLFTVDRQGNDFFLANGRWPTLEESLHLAEIEAHRAVLKKLVVPIKLAGKVMEALVNERISRAHLMPTLDNVSQTLRERWT